MSFNQIPGLFDHQYLWNEPFEVLDFLQGDSYRGKIQSKTATVTWVWPDVPKQAITAKNCWRLTFVNILKWSGGYAVGFSC